MKKKDFLMVFLGVVISTVFFLAVMYFRSGVFDKFH